ncbi:hypothetical protein CISEMA079M_04350 [Citrobacter sedlakii]
MAFIPKNYARLEVGVIAKRRLSSSPGFVDVVHVNLSIPIFVS